MRQQKLYLTILAVTGFLSLTSAGVYAGTCVISGAGLVTAHTIAARNGFRFFSAHISMRRTQWYVQPGRIGVKATLTKSPSSRTRAKTSAEAHFFAGKAMLNGWIISGAQHGSGSEWKLINDRGGINGLTVRKKVYSDRDAGKKVDINIRSIVLAHPTKSCGNDLVTQQMALKGAFGNR